jgi:hypothetical protein
LSLVGTQTGGASESRDIAPAAAAVCCTIMQLEELLLAIRARPGCPNAMDFSVISVRDGLRGEA